MIPVTSELAAIALGTYVFRSQREQQRSIFSIMEFTVPESMVMPEKEDWKLADGI
jgi:hypothetical protein